MKNPFLVILSVVSVGSFLGLAWVLAKPAPVDPRVAKLEAELKEARKTVADLRQQLASRGPVPVRNLASAQPAVPAAPEGLRSMMQSAAMQEMLEKQVAVQIDIQYGRLFDQLQLSPEERAHFKKLLLERQKVQRNLSLKLMDGNLSAEERTTLTDQLQQQLVAYDSTVKAFLNNDEDWRSYRYWEETMPERTQFETVGRGLFSATAEPLNGQQEQQLIEVMTQTRQQAGREANLGTQTGMDPTKLTDAMIELQLQQQDRNAEAVRAKAASFLTPSQLQTLDAYQKQAREMSRASIETSRMMIRGN